MEERIEEKQKEGNYKNDDNDITGVKQMITGDDKIVICDDCRIHKEKYKGEWLCPYCDGDYIKELEK